MKTRRAAEPRTVLIEERESPHGTPREVAISVAVDVSKLLAGGSRRLHGDVVDALVDLVVSLLDEDVPGQCSD